MRILAPNAVLFGAAGFSGYIQADAHAVYDALFRGDAVDDGAEPPSDQLDQAWSDLPPAARLQKRKIVLAPLVGEFFEWVRAQDDPSSQVRSLVKKSLGYAGPQERALSRFLDDGRLRMDNNLSENALRTIANRKKSLCFLRLRRHRRSYTLS